MTNLFYNDVLNYAHLSDLYNNTGPKGCKLCKQVFSNTQALLIHLEFHMAQEEIAIRRLYSLPQHVNYQKQFPLQPMADGRFFQSIGRNPFSNANQIGSSSMPIRRMQVQAQYDASMNDDGSKAYILKLEKPIKHIDFIDLVNIDEDNNSLQQLDLDLKL